MQTNKIYSKYDYNNYYLIPRSKDPRKLFGLCIKVNKKQRKLLSQTEYFKIEKIKNFYKGDYMDLYFYVSNYNSIKNNIFEIGNKKMLQKLNYLSKKHNDAKILKLLYKFEILKVDAYKYFYSRKLKHKSICSILLELRKFEEVNISVNFISGIGFNYEYLIEYSGYKFSYYSTSMPNIIDYDNLGKKEYYPDKVSNLSKVLDLIFDRFGKYMK